MKGLPQDDVRTCLSRSPANKAAEATPINTAEKSIVADARRFLFIFFFRRTLKKKRGGPARHISARARTAMTWLVPVSLAAIGISISARTFLTVVTVTVLIVLLLAELMPSPEVVPKSRQASARSASVVEADEQPAASESADPVPVDDPTPPASSEERPPAAPDSEMPTATTSKAGFEWCELSPSPRRDPTLVNNDHQRRKMTLHASAAADLASARLFTRTESV